MNQVNIIGNITRNPEVQYIPGNDPLAMCKLSVAVNDGYGEKKKTYFIPVTIFGKQAENCERFLSKGSRVGVTGKIVTGSYEKDGRKVYTTEVVANNIEFLSEANK